MGSSGNTGAPLNLNQWVGSDHPKRVDFNEDNRKTNQLAGTLLETEAIIEGNEAQRKANELERQDNEITRQTSEAARVAAETARAAAETARIAAENARATAETARQSYYNAYRVMENYSASKSYVPGNKVQYNGSTYQCIAASKGNAPPNATYWQLVAAKGASGDGSGDMVVADYGGSDGNTVRNADSLGGKPAAQYVLVHDESTGAIAQIQAIRGAPLSVSTEAIATQSGEGDPSPDNIRPIVGRDSVAVSVAGKNLCSLDGGIQNGAQVEISIVQDRIRVTSQASGAITRYGKIKVPGIGRAYTGSTITVRADWLASSTQTGEVRLAWFLKDFSGLGSLGKISASGESVTLDITEMPNDAECLGFLVYANADGGTTASGEYIDYKIQIELGSTSTAYEPYAGAIYPITMPQTIYGLPDAPDVVDVDAGRLIANSYLYEHTGNENWSNTSTTPGAGYIAVGRSLTQATKVNTICNALPYAPTLPPINSEKFTVTSSGTLQLAVSIARLADYGATDDRATHPAAIKAWLAALHAAGTPMQILYTPNTSATIPFTPPEIVAVDGQNNVWSDGGGMTTAKYDLADYFDKFNNALNALAGV
ncbi:hypothetical protein LJC42_00345 [Eubacteriales bacterium OttesenSCG-928-K08]|nr:hypothetical protein [Eubacteriales bacterium OttesenSCG-928-K08]